MDKKHILIKALTRINFEKSIEFFFRNYIDGLEDLANDIFEATGAIDFTDARKQKILKNASKLIDDFLGYHDQKFLEYIAIVTSSR